MRTWTLRRTEELRANPVTLELLMPGPDTVAAAEVEAFDETEALVALCAALGLAAVPCCELGEDACAACASEDQARQEDEGAEREAYRERQDPDVLRAQDSDRGGCR